ncbi:acyl-CoA carboxylase subunit epsilon [Streptomyces canus]|uniref:acyl-CoA carboxylase subunit epsilon n=1 Tax=Streptomyces canus TaxID=58343 RepID=UPI002DDC65DA|nr:acyl-CoA carboxylase subunit epsilon [Streptomyces canus]WSD83035.1 acyl-CoA carboxylase subunit epsilon [Streptomyces canus]WSD91797.1 acyl-CoA carboxylase subunit epsilon [Streptomyces canus]
MGDSGRRQPCVRVERGRASDEELAALTVVLLALYADGRENETERPVDGSRWWSAEAYRAPRSWQ